MRITTITTPIPIARRVSALAVAVAAGLALVGCTASDPAGADQPATQAAAVVASDVWVKAADEGMTAAFGTLANDGTETVRVVSVESDAATAMELHETVEDDAGQMIMREVDGFDIDPGASLTLEPGGDHLMVMGMPAAIVAGDDIVVTLTFDDGSTLDLTATARDYAGANESYEGGDMGDMGDMEHGDTTESHGSGMGDDDAEHGETDR